MSTKIRPWNADDYNAEEEALEVLGPVGQAEVLRDILEQRSRALSAAHDAAAHLVDAAKRYPEAVTVSGYVSSLDARDLLDVRDWRLACRQRHEAKQAEADKADFAWLAAHRAPGAVRVGEAVGEDDEA